MHNQAQYSVILNQINDSKHLSVEEKTALAASLDCASNINGDSGPVGAALQSMITANIIERLAEPERIQSLILDHATLCPMRQFTEKDETGVIRLKGADRALLGEIKTKYGTISGVAAILTILVFALWALVGFPHISERYFGVSRSVATSAK